jgi:hypothetical protein
MRVYLASPNTQQQAEHAADMPVLLSYAIWSPWVDRYQHTFARLLIDSGAYSQMNTGKVIDPAEYRDWAQRWDDHADAVAGLDDIAGDWRKSLKNYETGGGFPTMHDTDPPELLPDLIALARERGNWLGVGLMPPRHGKEAFVRWVCDNVPADIHVHGWALRAYTHVRRLNSVDSTNWYRDAMKYRRDLPWLTYGECLAIVVKRYQRESRIIRDEEANLFTEAAC